MPDHIQLDCPACGCGLRVGSEHIGRKVRCWRCRHRFRSPAENAAESPTAPRAQPGEGPTRVELNCPGCRRAVKVRSTYLGQTIQCRWCSQTFLARLENATSPPTGSQANRTPDTVAEGIRPWDDATPRQPRTPDERAARSELERRLLGELDESRLRAAAALARFEEERAAEVEQAHAEAKRLAEELRTAQAKLDVSREEIDRLRLQARAAEATGQRAKAGIQEQSEELARVRADLAEALSAAVRYEAARAQLQGELEQARAAWAAERSAASAQIDEHLRELKYRTAEVEDWHARFDAESRQWSAERELLRESCDRLGREVESWRAERDAAHERAEATGSERDQVVQRCEQAEARAVDLAALLAEQAEHAAAALADADRLRTDELDRLEQELHAARDEAAVLSRRLAESEHQHVTLGEQAASSRQEIEARWREQIEALEHHRDQAAIERQKSNDEVAAVREDLNRTLLQLEEQRAAMSRAVQDLTRERDEAAARADAAARERDELTQRLAEMRQASATAEQDRGEAGRLAAALLQATEAHETAARSLDEHAEQLRTLKIDLDRSRWETEMARAELKLAAGAYQDQLEAQRRQHHEAVEAARWQAGLETGELLDRISVLQLEAEALRIERDRLEHLRATAGPWPGGTTSPKFGRTASKPVERAGDPLVAGSEPAEAPGYRPARPQGQDTKDDPMDQEMSFAAALGAGFAESHIESANGGISDLLDLALEEIDEIRPSAPRPQHQMQVGGRIAPSTGRLQAKVAAKPAGEPAHPGESDADLTPEIDELKHEVVRLAEKGQLGAAIAKATRVADLTRTAVGEQHPRYATALMVLANLLREHGMPEQATSLHDRAEEILRGAPGETNLVIAMNLYDSARLQEVHGDTAGAMRLYERAAPIVIGTLGRDHPICQHILTRLTALAGGREPAVPMTGVICVGQDSEVNA